MVWKVRRGNLVSQHIEVALVYREMLGLEEAVEYLEREGVAREIVDRVLFTDQKRPPVKPVHDTAVEAPFAGCRRKNRVHDAIVEAALKIEKNQGMHMALHLLKEEQVPETVWPRILAREPGQLRARKTTS
jgi:hypothetical protein